MLMNSVEKALMNNPLRRSVQRRYEVPWLRRLAGPVPAAGKALEIGCGTGYGVELILRRFGGTSIDAVDLDPERLAKAQRRLAAHIDAGTVRLHQADGADLPWPDAHFDTVFDFGIIHHIPTRRAAVAEVGRVLRPGGRFYFEEVTRQFIDRTVWRLLLDHPSEDRFDAPQFADELQHNGLDVGGRLARPFFGEYFLGVAVQPGMLSSGDGAGKDPAPPAG